MPSADVDGATAGGAVCCRPDPARLEPFRECVATDPYLIQAYLDYDGDPNDEWKCGNVSQRAVAYSCGRLTRDDRPLDHRHDPAELELCARLATETAARLNPLWEGDPAGRPLPFRPYFAAVVLGEPGPAQLSEEVIRAAFGGTLHASLGVLVKPLRQHRGKWAGMPETEAGPRSDADLEKWADELSAASDTFGRWFVGVPDLRGHAHVSIGYSHTDPGVTKPRLVVALTPAGSLVGAATYVVQA
jgi:hypothetical protein